MFRVFVYNTRFSSNYIFEYIWKIKLFVRLWGIRFAIISLLFIDQHDFSWILLWSAVGIDTVLVRLEHCEHIPILKLLAYIIYEMKTKAYQCSRAGIKIIASALPPCLRRD